MSDQNPDFPQPHMPRMGRRNAIVGYEDDLLLLGIGAGKGTDNSSRVLEQSPIAKIGHRVSIDPEGKIAHQLAKEMIKHVEIDMRSVKITALDKFPDKTGTDVASPITTFNTSVLKEWKKLHESNSKIDGIQAILQEKSHIFTIPPQKDRKFLSRAPKVQVRSRSNSAERRTRVRSISSERGAPARARSISSERGAPARARSISSENRNSAEIQTTATLKPWRNLDEDDKHAPVQERRNVFESFKLTSVEPPETPTISQSRLRRPFKEKQKILNEPTTSDSEESLLFPKSQALKRESKQTQKNPYGNVLPRVNTRWNKWENLNNWKLSSVFERASSNIDKQSPTHSHSSRVHGGDGSVRSNTTAKTRVSAESNPGPNNKTKLGESYPASESSYPSRSHPTDKLPLTIGPRYNHKKAWRMINGVQNSEMMQDRRRFNASNPSYPFNNKVKYDPLIPHQIERQIRSPPTYSERSPFKSTFYNLHRINNGRMGASSGLGGRGGHIPPVGKRHSSLLNFDLVLTKSPPVVTTIQAPLSKFLASSISVYSQMNTIPINGQVMVDANTQPDKVNRANKGKDAQKKEANHSGGKAPAISKGNKQKPRIPKALPHARKDNAKKADVTGKSQRPAKGTNNANAHKAKLQTDEKVAPAMDKSSNIYSNIYIGPYSGSDSENETPNFTKKK